jgi:hypothetical protein
LMIFSFSWILQFWATIFHCWKAALVNATLRSPGKIVAFFIIAFLNFFLYSFITFISVSSNYYLFLSFWDFDKD